MSQWKPSNVTEARLLGLVKKGQLRPNTEDQEEWRVPEIARIPVPPPGFVVSFAPFHERGLATPAHWFIRGFLHHFKLELQHLNANGIQQLSAFIALCEGYLQIEPHFDL
jgi:hypothetical protein